MPISDTRLLVKIQYKFFEPGEFIEEAERNYDETIALIEKIPWEKERESIHIDLTVTSVTIQASDHSYLKLCLYYNGKFVLYFFDGKQLFSKSYLSYTEAYDNIKYYYVHKVPDIKNYKKENVILKELNLHFRTQNFIFKVTNSNPLTYLDGMSRFFIAGFVLLVLYIAIKSVNHSEAILPLILIVLFVFPLMGGLNLLLNNNYHKFAKGKILRLSRGAADFEYGPIDKPEKYLKADIESIIIRKNTSTRCPWNNFSLSLIFMRDGKKLIIPSILLSDTDTILKFPEIKTVTKEDWVPFIKKEI